MEIENSICKACFLFSLDYRTNQVIDLILSEVEEQHPKLVEHVKKDGSLPYHMTIIGGAKFPRANHKEIIDEVVSILKPFQDSMYLPQVWNVEMAEMNGNSLGIRLKFAKELPYIITGNRNKNVAIAQKIAPTFCFDSVRHINVCRVLGGFKEMDAVKPSFRHHLYKNRRELELMKLTPQVWIKEDSVWKQYEL